MGRQASLKVGQSFLDTAGRAISLANAIRIQIEGVLEREESPVKKMEDFLLLKYLASSAGYVERVDKSTVVEVSGSPRADSVINRLQKLSFIEQVPPGVGDRSNSLHYTITDEGRAFMTNMEPLIEGKLNSHFADQFHEASAVEALENLDRAISPWADILPIRRQAL